MGAAKKVSNKKYQTGFNAVVVRAHAVHNLDICMGICLSLKSNWDTSFLIYEDMIDHRRYTHNLSSSCEIKA